LRRPPGLVQWRLAWPTGRSGRRHGQWWHQRWRTRAGQRWLAGQGAARRLALPQLPGLSVLRTHQRVCQVRIPQGGWRRHHGQSTRWQRWRPRTGSQPGQLPWPRWRRWRASATGRTRQRLACGGGCGQAAQLPVTNDACAWREPGGGGRGGGCQGARRSHAGRQRRRVRQGARRLPARSQWHPAQRRPLSPRCPQTHEDLELMGRAHGGRGCDARCRRRTWC
jgi:hypothetical protein